MRPLSTRLDYPREGDKRSHCTDRFHVSAKKMQMFPHQQGNVNGRKPIRPTNQQIKQPIDGDERS